MPLSAYSLLDIFISSAKCVRALPSLAERGRGVRAPVFKGRTALNRLIFMAILFEKACMAGRLASAG